MQLMQSAQSNYLMPEPIIVETYKEEQALIAAAQKNPERFSALYERYYEPILKFVYHRVTTKEDAFDITQQVFLQAMVSIKKYEWRGFPFSSWLYRIAMNELNQAFRKNGKQRGINLSENHLNQLAEEMKIEPGNEKEQVLLDALTTLDEEDFQLVEMRFFEKRAFREIADILQITEANAKMKLYRILVKLKPEIEKKLNR
jgi:RNA polymerase sigma-70 factor, ECF subfamily